MSNYQYCDDCDEGLNPTPADIIEGKITCTCGTENEIPYRDQMMKELLQQLVSDVEALKQATETGEKYD